MRMKLSILFALLLGLGTLSAQNTALGVRAPRVRSFKPQIEEGNFLYMGFIHSPSRPCEISAPRVVELINNNDAISAVLFTREPQGDCEQWLIDLFSDGCQVQMGADEIFQKFGVEYAPFGIILDHKRRVVWLGNPQILTKAKIEKIINKWSLQK